MAASARKVSPSWVRTSDLQVNSLTRYRLRHGGTLLLMFANTLVKLPLVGLEPTIFGLGSQRLIH